MKRTGLTLLGNWIVGAAFVYATHIPDAWWFSIVIDAIAARIILHQPAGTIQALVGIVYMAQIVLHVVYAFSNHMWGQDAYWRDLTNLAYLQMALLGWWILGKARRLIWQRRHPRLANAASTTGLGSWSV